MPRSTRACAALLHCKLQVTSTCAALLHCNTSCRSTVRKAPPHASLLRSRLLQQITRANTSCDWRFLNNRRLLELCSLSKHTHIHTLHECSLSIATCCRLAWSCTLVACRLQCPPSRQPALYFACTCLGFVGAFLALMRLMPYVLQALATAGIGHGVVLVRWLCGLNRCSLRSCVYIRVRANHVHGALPAFMVHYLRAWCTTCMPWHAQMAA